MRYETLVIRFENGKGLRLSFRDVPVADNATDAELAKAAMLALAKRIQDDPILAAKQLATEIFIEE